VSVRHRGVVLVELLVAGFLTAVVVGLALGSLMMLQQAAQQQLERAARHSNLLGTARLIRAELGGLSPRGGDLARLGREQMEYRATRATGWICGRAADGLLLASGLLRALRLPAAGRDSILLLTSAGDSVVWAAHPVGAAPRLGSCPGDGAPALVLPVSATARESAVVPGPVAVFERMELRAYQSGSDWWLGLRSVPSGETIQPATGPFSSGGVLFKVLDDFGAEVTEPDLVRRIAVRLRGIASRTQGIGAGARALRTGSVDSLVFEVVLRGDP
jgi:hypothetical protein